MRNLSGHHESFSACYPVGYGINEIFIVIARNTADTEAFYYKPVVVFLEKGEDIRIHTGNES